MNDPNTVTFSRNYDNYRTSVKACLFPWLLAGILTLIFSVIRYVHTNSLKVTHIFFKMPQYYV